MTDKNRNMGENITMGKLMGDLAFNATRLGVILFVQAVGINALLSYFFPEAEVLHFSLRHSIGIFAILVIREYLDFRSELMMREYIIRAIDSQREE